MLLSRFSIHKRIEGGATSESYDPPVVVITFQYPQADRRGCNRGSGCARRQMYRVSVSTSGSKGVQPAKRLGNTPAKCGFQYPQADRRGCNRCAGYAVYPDQRVSVSTSGSKGVQRFHFSLLSKNFLRFQYPQADRRGCNGQDVRLTDAAPAGFSIHKRIEGGATECNC